MSAEYDRSSQEGAGSAPDQDLPAAPAGGQVQEEISHDKIFKTAFGLFFKDLMELLHPEIAALLDLGEPKIFSDEAFADFRKQGHVEPDLVAETRTRSGEPSHVEVHVEIEGEFRRAMDERMERYGMELTLKYRCLVISVAVSLSGGSTGIERRKCVRRLGFWEGNRFFYLAFCPSQCLAEEWVDRPQPLAPALAALMPSKVWDQVEQKLRCLRAIWRAETGDRSVLCWPRSSTPT